MSQDTAAQSGTPAVVVEETAVVKPLHSLGARLAAEAFGTFFLVLAIVGTATFNALNQNSILPVALAGGIALLAAVAAVGHVSGGHFNPAVTLGAALAGHRAWRDLLPYWAAQLVGSAVAAVVLWSIIPDTLPELLQLGSKSEMIQATANGYGEHSPIGRLSQGQTEFSLLSAVIVEVIITAVLMGVILGTRDRRAKFPYSPFAAGLALTALIIVAWPVTNASLNPARSFASALFGGDWTWGQLWLFAVAPLAGAALAALFYRAFAPTEEVEVIEETVVAEPAGSAGATDVPVADEKREPTDAGTASGTVTINEPTAEPGDPKAPKA